jgi:hypothetical protein
MSGKNVWLTGLKNNLFAAGGSGGAADESASMLALKLSLTSDCRS